MNPNDITKNSSEYYNMYSSQPIEYSYQNDYFYLQHYNQLLHNTMTDPSNYVNPNYMTNIEINYNQLSTYNNLMENTNYANFNVNSDARRTSCEPALSPEPNGNADNNSQFTPSTNMDVLKTYYPTPPSDDSFIRDKQEEPNHRSTPELPQDDSIENSKKVKRRTRTQFTKYQVDCLEAIFNKNHYPDVQTVDRLSETLSLAIERISVWFQNRRAKFKKVKKPSSASAQLDGRNGIQQNIYHQSNHLMQNSNNEKSYNTANNTTNSTWPYFKANVASAYN